MQIFQCWFKYKEKCKFTHTKEICNAYLDGECDGKGLSCQDRHPKACKWFTSETGCKGKMLKNSLMILVFVVIGIFLPMKHLNVWDVSVNGKKGGVQ